jgi:hypothetical protein
MGGAYAMGAPWLRFAGRCNPALGRELSDWLAKMTGAAAQAVRRRSVNGAPQRVRASVVGASGVQASGRGGAQVEPGALRRPAAGISGRPFWRSWRSSR